MTIRILILVAGVLAFLSCSEEKISPEPSPHDLRFGKLAKSWDEGIPLGNGMLGALVWQKEGHLRISLDRADLWDLRPTANLDKPEWRFSWVYEQWKKDNYGAVQEYFDVPYDRDPAPSKIPAGALEFDISALGKVDSVLLYVEDALCEVRWENGATLRVFVHATDPVGWFRFTGVNADIMPAVVPPAYSLEGTSGADSPVAGQDLRRLGYPKGELAEGENEINYLQQGWGGFSYRIGMRWAMKGHALEGCWSVSSDLPGRDPGPTAQVVVEDHFNNGFRDEFSVHQQWWENYWAKSSVRLPDPVLEKQYYLDMYKFGAAARDGAPPISLQAVWTADNGRLPPWKGDFHHDLNTQLSYWPAYIGNHLEEGAGFLNWMWENKPAFEKYTRTYYEKPGINVPGVTTLTGQPMGGWIQYSFGPTVSAWLGHHFYQHWIFSGDSIFLEERAYPWLKDVATFLLSLSVKDEYGLRKLPISSSPEINDNAREAWFAQTTNFDLALIRWTFLKAGELAGALGLDEEASRWHSVLSEWPDLIADPEEGLMFATNFPYNTSHRHFSHLMGYHPLGLLDYSNGKDDRLIIDHTLQTLDRHGSDWWTGYSFSWLGNLKARAFDGDGAAEALRTFATAFCLPNSFHVNGDQSGKGYSRFTYRPFTLEGNFAFASGIQEMLLQSHTGVVRVFPAVPGDWADVRFTDLRAAGAFLVSAEKTKGKVVEVVVKSEQGGIFRMINPFAGEFELTGADFLQRRDTLEIDLAMGQRITIIGY